MGSVIDLSRGVSLSLRQLADETGFHRDTITKRIRDANLRPNGKRGGYPVYRLREILQLLYQAGDDGFDPDKLDPFKRKAYYQGELDKLKVATEKGELVPRIEAEQEMAAILKIVAEGHATLPDILERDCGLTPSQLARVEARLDELREEMYGRLTEDEDDDADRTAGERA